MPEYTQHRSLKRVEGYTEGPNKFTTLDDIRKQSKQKNADKRFNSPFAFHEPKYKKPGLFVRYPKLFTYLFSGTALVLFFSKPIYDITTRKPTQYEIDRANFLKARMKARGWWDNPFWSSETAKPGEE